MLELTATNIDFIAVCGCDSLSKSRTNHQLVDLANTLLDLGIDRALVSLHVQLQVRRKTFPCLTSIHILSSF